MTEPSGSLTLNERTAKAKSLNFAPESHGDELVERVDLSLEFLAEQADIDALVIVLTGTATEWLYSDDGQPVLLDVGPIAVARKFAGDLTLGENGSKESLAFEGALLKKIKLEPMIGRKAAVTAQVRFDPDGQLEALGRMVIDTTCRFSFSGARAQDAAKNNNQTQMEV